MVNHPEDCAWSSYPAIFGKGQPLGELSEAGELREIAKTQRYTHRTALDSFFEADEAKMLPPRDERIWRANRE